MSPDEELSVDMAENTAEIGILTKEKRSLDHRFAAKHFIDEVVKMK